MNPRASAPAPASPQPSRELALRVAASLAFSTLVALGVASCFVNDVFEGSTGTPCAKVSDCDAIDNPCVEVTCTEGFCGSKSVPDGVGPLTNAPGDCRTRSCKSGEVVDAVDDTDRDDNDPCTADDCEAGVPEHEQLDPGAECFIGTAQGSCDADGECEVACAPSIPCPAHEECATWDCEQGICVRNEIASGDPVAPLRPFEQAAGDCRRFECVDGEKVEVDDDEDVPLVLAVECLTVGCDEGSPTSAAAALNAPCGVGLMCNMTGECRTCTMAPDCDNPAIECHTPACNMGRCSQEPEPMGTPCMMAPEEPGVCDADARCVECLTPAECGQTATSCAANECIDGACVRVPELDFSSCGSGNFCSDGACVQCVSDAQCTGNKCCGPGGSCKNEPCD